jgi:hypothetical protein
LCDHSLGLDLDQPARIDERCDNHCRIRRPDLAEGLAVGAAEGLEVGGRRQVDPCPHDVGE